MLAVMGWSCASDEIPESPEASAPPTSMPTDTVGPAKRYDSIDALASDLEKGGVVCTDLGFLKQKNPTLKEFALCDPEKDPHQRLNIYLFKKSADRDQWMGSIVQSGLPWIFGPNWIIVGAGQPTTAEQRLEQVREAIGGQVANVEF